MMSAAEIFIARGASQFVQALPQDGQIYRTNMHETIEDGPKLETGSLEDLVRGTLRTLRESLRWIS